MGVWEIRILDPIAPLLPVPGQEHVQEVILRVAVEGAAEAHGVLHPSLVHLQVEPKAFSIVEHPHAHVGPHPQEHGGQPPDLKGVWAQNPKGGCGEVEPLCTPPATATTYHLHGALRAPYPAQPSHTLNPAKGVVWGALRKSAP